MRTVVGVAEARAQLSDIVAQAANGQVTVIERYGRPTAAVIPFDALKSLPDSGVSTDPKPSARHRQAQLLDALARLQEAVEAQTPQDADLIYEALNFNLDGCTSNVGYRREPAGVGRGDPDVVNARGTTVSRVGRRR